MNIFSVAVLYFFTFFGNGLSTIRGSQSGRSLLDEDGYQLGTCTQNITCNGYNYWHFVEVSDIRNSQPDGFRLRMVVYVQGSNDGHILLASSEHEESVYEIVLGGWGNTKSVIRKRKQGENLVTAEVRNIMNPNEPIKIGVEVTNDGYIQVFTEKFKPLIVLHDNNPILVRFISFAGFNSIVQFSYDCGTGPSINAEAGRPLTAVPALERGTCTQSITCNGYNYWHFVKVSDIRNSQPEGFRLRMVVYVQGPNDGHILLASSEHEESVYEIVLGGWGNTKSVIRKRKQGENLVTAAVRNVMNPDRPIKVGVEVTNDGYVHVFTEKLHPLMVFYDDNPIPIRYISFAGFNSVVQFFYDCSADSSTNANTGPVTIFSAAEKGELDGVKTFIENGADVNSVNNEKLTPLHVSSKYGHTAIAKLLLERGANVSAEDKYKLTPLHYSAQRENEDLVKLLLQNGAKRNAKNWEGASSYDIARQTGNTRISDLFKQALVQNIQSACLSYPVDYIYNGELTKDGEFPWMAALGYVNERNYRVTFDCGGTIISNFFILTAAHCVKTRQPSVVRMGKISLSDVDGEDESRTVNRHVQEVIPHPNHSFLTKRNDIALLRLKREIPFSDNVKPACLQTDTRDEPANVKLIVTGWGIISKNNTRSNDLRKAQLMTMPLSQCNRTLMEWGVPRSEPAVRDGLIGGQYCAYDPQGRNDSCQGDSGGPLQYFPTKESKVATVLGIVSFGIGCGSRLPSVYTRVAHYLDWIEPIAWSEL